MVVLAAGWVTNGHAGMYAPAAGEDGSTAIYKDDESIIGWASGYQDLIYGEGLSESWKTPEKALGKAVGSSTDIVSLGRGGQITLTFDDRISNVDGADFAVFENSFSAAFLELAWVEVSSDGIHYLRMPNDSQTASAVGAFGSSDPTDIDGLAGKYKQGYGTPFDLTDLMSAYSADELAKVDLDDIGYVRIIDIVGDGSALDSSGDVIYDPYMTSGSAGFDLEAVAVIPEPGTIALLVIGALGVLSLRRSRI
jgi:hypothetical protein